MVGERCEACGAAWQSSYVCQSCEIQLGNWLAMFGPQWIDGRRCIGLLEALEDESIGRTAKDSAARWIRSEPFHLDGDAHPIEPLPDPDPDSDEPDLDKAREDRANRLRRRLLRTGKVNEAASDRLAEITKTLRLWATALAKTHRTVINPMNPLRVTATDYASWLSVNTRLIVQDEDAGHFYRTIKNHVRAAERMVDLPDPPMGLGECPTVINDKHGKRNCATELAAMRGAEHVTCPSCKETYKVEKLLILLINDADNKRFTWKELAELLRKLPPDERPNPRTLREWRASGRLKPCGYLRPDGFRGVTRQTDLDEPEYKFSDVRKLHAEKPQQVTTGAAAHTKATA